LLGASEATQPAGTPPPPTLGSLATGVEMYYLGKVYRGFFTSFQITEAADNFLYNYSIGFTITQERGFRTNSFAWNRNPNFGPSNSDPYLGAPLSYSRSTNRYTSGVGPAPTTSTPGVKLFDLF